MQILRILKKLLKMKNKNFKLIVIDTEERIVQIWLFLLRSSAKERVQILTLIFQMGDGFALNVKITILVEE